MLILTDDFAESDLIGHEDYRDGLMEVIREVETKSGHRRSGTLTKKCPSPSIYNNLN
ncbi:MAG: hypothetical protein OEV64_12730 [Desulfobulbaceae bacterium]|nr:hypothetical protein [Desulfobulbaceae bacterium]